MDTNGLEFAFAGIFGHIRLDLGLEFMHLQNGKDEILIDTKILDVDCIKRLNELGGLDFVASMADLFQTTTEERLGKAEAGLLRGDLQPTEDATHALVTSSGFMGALCIKALAEKAQRSAEAHDMKATRDYVKQLRILFEETKPDLQLLKSNLAGLG